MRRTAVSVDSPSASGSAGMLSKSSISRVCRIASSTSVIMREVAASSQMICVGFGPFRGPSDLRILDVGDTPCVQVVAALSWRSSVSSSTENCHTRGGRRAMSSSAHALPRWAPCFISSWCTRMRPRPSSRSNSERVRAGRPVALAAASHRSVNACLVVNPWNGPNAE